MPSFLHLYISGFLQVLLNFIAHVPSQWLRMAVLRLLGLKVAQRVVIHGGFEIRAPWKIRIGAHTSIGTRATLDGRAGITIGERVNLSSEVMIWTVQHDHRDPAFNGVKKTVVIEDYVWLGPRVILLPGVRIAKGCVIAAGAIVTHDTEAFGIYAGIPARRIGERQRNLSYKPTERVVPFI